MADHAELLIYTTDGCHLCDLAVQVIAGSIDLEAVCVEMVDIAEASNADELIERYGIRIPVVYHVKSGQELNWPFDQTHFLQWFRSLV